MQIDINIWRVTLGWNFVTCSGRAELGESHNINSAWDALRWNFCTYGRTAEFDINHGRAELGRNFDINCLTAELGRNFHINCLMAEFGLNLILIMEGLN